MINTNDEIAVKDPHDLFSSIEISYINNQIKKITANEFAIRFWLFEAHKTKGSLNVKLKGVYKPGILEELYALGFYKRFDQKDNVIFIREDNNIIAEVNIPIINDAFYEGCIKVQTQPIKFQMQGVTFEFSVQSLQKVYLNNYHLIFNDAFLHHLKTHEKPILKDEKSCSYFLFQNCIVKTSKSGVEKLKYSDLVGKSIWEGHILDSIFEYVKEYVDCHFYRFLMNVSNQEQDRFDAFKSATGYLAHHYNRPTGGQVVIAYDESPAAKGQPQGGTGKGVFINAIKQIRDVIKIDGKKYRSDDKFKWQGVTHTTQVVWLDDVHSKFPFEDLHSNSTDGWNIERKYDKEFYLPPFDSPKLFIASNTILTNSGSTNKRRQFIIEFSDHYSRHIKTGTEEPIKDEHGCIFFDHEDWDKDEWSKFYSFMIDCSVDYLKNGLIPYQYRGLLKNQLLQSTSEDFVEWIENNGPKIEIKYDLKELFEDFKSTYYGEDSDLKQRAFTNWLQIWAGLNNLRIEKTKSNGRQYIKTVTK